MTIGKPNILQITTHDSGRHFGCYGNRTLHTPNIDALAASGVKLCNYFAAVPICCASRATMLTGRYPQSHGLMDLCFAPFNWALNDDEQHISHILHGAGYRTILVGVQHEVANPARLAFDDIRARNAPCDIVAREAADFLTNRAPKDKPFYAQVGFFETHTPFGFGGVEPDESRGVEVPPYLVDDDTARRAMARFQGAVRKVDEAVGVIMDALRRSGAEDRTLTVFTTDHGIEMPRAKWCLYDPGIAIGLIMRYPAGGVTGGKEHNLLLSNVDYLPTVLESAGLDIHERVQGRSFASVLNRESPAPVRNAVFAMYHKNQTRCVRTSRFKLIRHFEAATDYHSLPVRCEDILMKRGIKQVELFDLENDPNEFDNVADQPEYAEAQGELNGMLWEWMESVNDPLLDGPPSSPSYEAAMRDFRSWGIRGAQT